MLSVVSTYSALKTVSWLTSFIDFKRQLEESDHMGPQFRIYVTLL
jgi:hypothetical protein